MGAARSSREFYHFSQPSTLEIMSERMRSVVVGGPREKGLERYGGGGSSR